MFESNFFNYIFLYFAYNSYVISRLISIIRINFVVKIHIIARVVNPHIIINNSESRQPRRGYREFRLQSE